MKKTLLGVVAIAALMGTPAFAADLALKAPPPPPPAASWTGCYIGANVGGIWEHDNTPITLFDPTGIATVAFTTGRIPSSFSYGVYGEVSSMPSDGISYYQLLQGMVACVVLIMRNVIFGLC